MSFITKSIKKSWNFTKKYWKEIALVAAIVFTAGIATVGFAAFAGVSSFGGFMGAVGTTMWAGVAGAAGTVGIGAGATVPTTAATVAAGTAGTQVGLGAAWGAGAGFTTSTGAKASLGWDMTGKIAAASLEKGSAAAYNQGVASGLSKEAARKEAANFATQFTTDAAGNLTKAGAKVAAKQGTNTGMEIAKAWGPTVAATVGPALVGLGGDGEDPGGAPIWGSFAGGERQEAKGRAAQESLPVLGPETPEAGTPMGGSEAAGGLLNAQISRPLQGNTGRRGYDGRLLDIGEEDDMGLMGRYGGGYGYAT